MSDTSIPISREFSEAAAALFVAWDSFSILADESARGAREVPDAEVLAVINDVRAALVRLDGEVARLEHRVREGG